jgi:cephalosporin hydroxylase
LKFTVDTEAWTITRDGDQAGDPERAPNSWFDESGFALLSQWWLQASWQRKYSYQFRWLGRPIIQLPADIMMIQDLIHRIRPTLIIETGIAHGGSLVFHASLLRLVHQTISNNERPHVIGIDIEIRPANHQALNDHPLRSMMTLVEASSTDPSVHRQIADGIRADDVVMVILDSDHRRDHALAELDAYAPLVSRGSAIVVMDGIMPQLAKLPSGKSSWTADHPAEAVRVFLASPLGRGFQVDRTYDGYAMTHSPGGVLTRVSGP